MEERRKTPRLQEENEVTITVVSGESDFPKEKIIDNFTKDISAGGARIRTNILMPVDTLIELEFASKGLRQQISALGKVKWVRVLIEDQSYEAGVEFSGEPGEAVRKLEEYISWKLKSNKAEFIKKKLSPMDSGDVNIIPAEEPSPVHSDDVRIAETTESRLSNLGDGKEAEPPLSFTIHAVDEKTSKINEGLPGKRQKGIPIFIFIMCVMVLMAALLQAFGFLPSFDSMFNAGDGSKKEAMLSHRVSPVPAGGAVVPSENFSEEIQRCIETAKSDVRAREGEDAVSQNLETITDQCRKTYASGTPLSASASPAEPVSEDSAVKTLIDRWMASWRSGDMGTYRHCYASDFRSKEKDLNAWIAHKTSVFRNSKNIVITIDDLKITVDGQMATAVFIQNYSSSAIKTSGKKTLELKKMDNEWKIYKEIM